MKRLTLSAFILLACCGVAFAALHFPALTGRVVDDAKVLSSSAVASLDQALEDYERGTTNQVVVVTLPSLQGDSIEDYGYQLGRAWGIGQKGKNNGVLLIVVPSEHKVRIEVGYGLEGVLTDAASSVIVQSVILPDFRAGHMEQGITEGTQAILSVLGGKGVPAPSRMQVPQNSTGGNFAVIILIILFVILARRHPFIAAYLLANNSFRAGSSGFGGGDFGGGFSGGGGSFGGGGSSGSW